MQKTKAKATRLRYRALQYIDFSYDNNDKYNPDHVKYKRLFNYYARELKRDYWFDYMLLMKERKRRMKIVNREGYRKRYGEPIKTAL